MSKKGISDKAFRKRIARRISRKHIIPMWMTCYIPKKTLRKYGYRPLRTDPELFYLCPDGDA